MTTSIYIFNVHPSSSGRARTGTTYLHVDGREKPWLPETILWPQGPAGWIGFLLQSLRWEDYRGSRKVGPNSCFSNSHAGTFTDVPSQPSVWGYLWREEASKTLQARSVISAGAAIFHTSCWVFSASPFLRNPDNAPYFLFHVQKPSTLELKILSLPKCFKHL